MDRKRLWALEFFLLKMLLLSVPLYAVVSLGVDLAPLQLEVARESHWALTAAGIGAERYGAGIIAQSGDNTLLFVISPDCTAWKVMLFFSALVLAVPGRRVVSRSLALAAGLALIWVLNIGRIVAIVGFHFAAGPAAALLLHDYLWQLGLGGAALAAWYAWMRAGSLSLQTAKR